MLAVRGLPSVPEEDMLPEVEGAAPDLPASPAAPVTLASTTTGLQYPPSPTTTFLSSPTHHQYRPAIHHHHHHQDVQQQQQQQQAREPQQQQQQLVPVPTQSPPVYPATLTLQQLPQPTTPPQLQQAHTTPPQLQQGHTQPLLRTFLRSQSQQELGAGQAAAAASSGAPSHHDAFAVPKVRQSLLHTVCLHPASPSPPPPSPPAVSGFIVANAPPPPLTAAVREGRAVG